MTTYDLYFMYYMTCIPNIFAIRISIFRRCYMRSGLKNHLWNGPFDFLMMLSFVNLIGGLQCSGFVQTSHFDSYKRMIPFCVILSSGILLNFQGIFFTFAVGQIDLDDNREANVANV